MWGPIAEGVHRYRLRKHTYVYGHSHQSFPNQCGFARGVGAINGRASLRACFGNTACSRRHFWDNGIVIGSAISTLVSRRITSCQSVESTSMDPRTDRSGVQSVDVHACTCLHMPAGVCCGRFPLTGLEVSQARRLTQGLTKALR